MGYEKNQKPGKFFQTMHSPRGAYASFVFGDTEPAGMLFEEAGIGKQDIFVGIKQDMEVRCLPLFKGESGWEGEDAYAFGQGKKPEKVVLRRYKDDDVTRTLGMATDTVSAQNLTFSVASPVSGLPDPDKVCGELFKKAIMPAIPAKITVDNTAGSETVTGVFGLREMLGVYALSDSGRTDIEGAMDKNGCGFAFDTAQHGGRIKLVADFGPERIFNRHSPEFYRLDTMSGFIFEVKPGEKITVDFMLGWFNETAATHGAHKLKYYYTKYFSTAEEMFSYAVKQAGSLWEEAYAHDKRLEMSPLSPERKLLLAHAMHCYWASSMLFDDGGRPRYVVNEGSFVMMNTFDLSVDHLFYETLYQPWTVRNQLDFYADEYSYYDTVHPHDDPDTHYPGGIAFTHDQGVHNTFSPKGYSAYEHVNKHGCLSYMSHEELVNWVVCAAVYFNATDDKEWLTRRKGVILDCLTSMLNRDHFDPAQRDGVMDLESDRCGIAGEITSYDCIDPSLGQARRNMYLASKCFGAYLSLYRMLTAIEDSSAANAAEEAMAGAKRLAATIVKGFDPALGFVPSILDGENKTAIIPALEGFVFPAWAGLPEMTAYDGPFAELMETMKKHFTAIMKPGVCLFDDGGWRLSASSINSWMSKIFLLQYTTQTVLGLTLDEVTRHEADVAHMNWWTNITKGCPGIDQIFWGNEFGAGFHYPRAITAILWLCDAKGRLTI